MPVAHRLEARQVDIVTLKVDAIVNAANTTLPVRRLTALSK